jgi:SlyX protein
MRVLQVALCWTRRNGDRSDRELVTKVIVAGKPPCRKRPDASENDRAQSRVRPEDNAMESRIADIEVKLSFCEDLVEELNKVVFRQQQQIEQLQKEMVAVRDQVRMAAPAEKGDPREDVPPHY